MHVDLLRPAVQWSGWLVKQRLIFVPVDLLQPAIQWSGLAVLAVVDLSACGLASAHCTVEWIFVPMELRRSECRSRGAYLREREEDRTE